VGVTQTKEAIMPNAVHTPGPWATYRLARDSDLKERLIVVTRDGETEICGVIHNEADACLIAAAPELLAIAQFALDYLDGQEYLQACAIIASAQNE
jgi:hypothetical protein